MRSGSPTRASDRERVGPHLAAFLSRTARRRIGVESLPALQVAVQVWLAYEGCTFSSDFATYRELLARQLPELASDTALLDEATHLLLDEELRARVVLAVGLSRVLFWQLDSFSPQASAAWQDLCLRHASKRHADPHCRPLTRAVMRRTRTTRSREHRSRRSARTSGRSGDGGDSSGHQTGPGDEPGPQRRTSDERGAA